MNRNVCFALAIILATTLSGCASSAKSKRPPLPTHISIQADIESIQKRIIDDHINENGEVPWTVFSQSANKLAIEKRDTRVMSVINYQCQLCAPVRLRQTFEFFEHDGSVSISSYEAIIEGTLYWGDKPHAQDNYNARRYLMDLKTKMEQTQ